MIGTPAYTYPGGTLTSSQYGNVISTDGSQGTFTPQDRGNVILLPGCGLKGAAFYAIFLAVVSPTAVVVDMPCLNSTVGAGNTLTIFGLRSTNDGSIAAGGFVLSAPGALWSYWDIGAWVSVAGALVVAWADQVTASPARSTKATPPGANAGSLDPRAREDRAKLLQRNLPSLVFWNVASWVMPADEPFGRAIGEHPDFSAIESPIAPVSGLVASQLNRCVAVAPTVGLKSAPNWSSTF